MLRTRRLRAHAKVRDLVRENTVTKNDLIMPVFIEEGKNIKTEIESMPGIYRFSLDRVGQELDEISALGLPAILLFGVPKAANKDACGSQTWSDEGIIQQAIRQIKKSHPDLYIITDVCFCEYTDHGHCGVLDGAVLDNDQSLENLAKQTLSHAQAGADMVAPSGMLDGSIETMREALDEGGYVNLPIMGYSVKYSSAYYGPFRDAVGSAPSFGDRKTYQMDPANRREGMVRAEYDDMEGADILMVKPALSYLDIIRDLRENFDKPIACYNVSGEYAMIKAASANGWVDGEAVMAETLLSMKRAGADQIITYFAKDMARLLDTQ